MEQVLSNHLVGGWRQRRASTDAIVAASRNGDENELGAVVEQVSREQSLGDLPSATPSIQAADVTRMFAGAMRQRQRENDERMERQRDADRAHQERIDTLNTAEREQMEHNRRVNLEAGIEIIEQRKEAEAQAAEERSYNPFNSFR